MTRAIREGLSRCSREERLREGGEGNASQTTLFRTALTQLLVYQESGTCRQRYGGVFGTLPEYYEELFRLSD